MEEKLELFKARLAELSVVLTEEQIQQFLTYYEMLVEKNKVMNLTAITEFDEVLEKHFLDSISLCRVLNCTKEHQILDLGTGAGFPGIPLKIAFPSLKITLVDSLNKRVGFLNEVIEELGLENIKAIHERAELLASNSLHREKYDICVSRAVANLSTLSEYCLPFVKVGGSFISYKSGDIEEELSGAKNAISILGGKLENVDKFTIGESKRSFVMISKIHPTAKKYPRKAGTPSKQPL